MRRDALHPTDPWRYLAARFAVAGLGLFTVVTVCFAAIRLGPNEPAALVAGPGLPPVPLPEIRAELGTNAPLGEQYVRYVGDLLALEFGRTWVLGPEFPSPARPLLVEAAPFTLAVAVGVLCLVTAVAVPVGLAAGHLDGRRGTGVEALATLGRAVPNFWLALVLVALLGASRVTSTRALLLLSVVAVAATLVASRVRTVSRAVREARQDGHVDAARAKGLSRSTVFWRHLAPVALLAHLRRIADDVTYVAGAVVVVETVVLIRSDVTDAGLGDLFFQAAVQGDLPLAATLVVLFTAAVVAVRLLGDLVLALVDPRVGSRAGRH
ncbi:ABC transporter permease subunit [Haloarchaeobius iranensis]|uniref:Peptide/nickel transport system permease protein n=1 Tax=Haloarchaeobius iranensis TaxID=996166 RepID=A0A1G9S9V0_9EURY|nr:ABC transporter permease [Haloarchaeobius iranensis]SDM32236.1 peptide/nickel transport system permease protein [Haloarchaeobius iranensis]